MVKIIMILCAFPRSFFSCDQPTARTISHNHAERRPACGGLRNVSFQGQPFIVDEI